MAPSRRDFLKTGACALGSMAFASRSPISFSINSRRRHVTPCVSRRVVCTSVFRTKTRAGLAEA